MLIGACPLRSAHASVCSAPTFAAPRTFNAGTNSNSVAVADFNGDGKSDLAAVTREGVSVLLGNGDGNFQTAVNYGAGTNPVFVASADFNDDARLDLVVVTKDRAMGLTVRSRSSQAMAMAPSRPQLTTVRD